MVFDQIEKVKQEYTDKYVKVDADRAELARFKDLVGQVKTVNMSGRALVEFMDYHLNIGWFDIDLDYLKVVDKPAPKPKEEKKPAAKKAAPKKPAATAEKKLSPLEMARQADGGKKAGGGEKKKSTADVLAALRGEKGGAKSEAKPAAAKAEAPATETAAPTKPASDKPAAMDRSKMSVADMIAAARGGDTPTAEPTETEPEPEVEAPAAEPEAEAAPEPAAETPSDGAVGPVDKSSMSIDEMLAYCREKDAS